MNICILLTFNWDVYWLVVRVLFLEIEPSLIVLYCCMRCRSCLSSADCQPCGNGTYRSEPCTEVYDAGCALCSEACEGGDHFVLSPCTAEADLDCHRECSIIALQKSFM